MNGKLLGACAALAAMSWMPAKAAIIDYTVTGTIGSDTLSGTLAYDTSLPANGLEPVYSSLSLTVTGTDLGPVNVPLAATYSDIFYWPPQAQPGPYFVLSPSNAFAAVVDSDGGFTNWGAHDGTYTGYANYLELRIPESPTALGSTPFTVFIDQEYISNGVPFSDNITYGSAVLSAVPEPATWAMMMAGLGCVGFVLHRRNRGAPRPSV